MNLRMPDLQPATCNFFNESRAQGEKFTGSLDFLQKILECALALTVDAATPTRATSVRTGWIPFSAATNGNGKGYGEPDAASWMPIRTYTRREEAEWREFACRDANMDLQPGLFEQRFEQRLL